VRELALGARLTLAGGRAGLLRTGATAVAVGLGVAVLLVAASLPAMRGGHVARGDARVATDRAAPGPGTVLVAEVPTEFRGRQVKGRLLEPGGPRAPLPPGLIRMPRPGEVFVSPALRDLLATGDGHRLLAPRIPGRVAGTVAPPGLLGPSELAFYAGARGLGEDARRVDHFGTSVPSETSAVLGVLTVIVLVALLLPVAVLVGTAVRTGGEDRDRRLAALRLVGADHGMTRRIAAGEALVAAGLGLVLGAVLFLVIRANAERVTLWDLSVFSFDVRPSLPLALLVAVGVPAAAVLVSLLALRRVVAEPLGVVRRAEAGRRRLWWRLLLPAAGLLTLATALGKDAGDAGELRVGAGVIALLLGVVALLPWVVERAVARLGGGAVAWQLAVRRLQLDPAGPARAVSGITVAVAGAIALQMVVTGVQEDFKTDTRSDPARATLYATVHDPPLPAAAVAARLAAAPGARSVAAVSDYGVAGWPELTLHVAPCAALRDLIRFERCTDGDVFRTASASPRVALTEHTTWPVPGRARTVTPRADPTGRVPGGVFATPVAVRGLELPPPRVDVFVRVDPRAPDAVEQVRNAAAAISPLLHVEQLRRTRTDAQFDALRRAMFVGAAIVICLIGCSLLLTALDQLRERRSLLAVLAAFGTRRSTLGWSVLWQSAVPVALGLAIAVLTGLTLGAVLLRIFDTAVHVGWLDVAGMAGVSAAVVLAVTAASLPVLWRTMRPEALRTE
jgi:hypothetical protein